MTRKDYIKFANMVVDLTRNNQESFTRNNLINRLIDIFSEDNYRFDENKFINMHVGGYNKEYYFMADTLTEKTDNNYSYSIPAQLMTMDTLYISGVLSKIDFLKIDIEGAEIQLFRGISDENLEKINKITMEYHPQFILYGVEQLKERLDTFFEIVYNTPITGGLEIYNYRRRC